MKGKGFFRFVLFIAALILGDFGFVNYEHGHQAKAVIFWACALIVVLVSVWGLRSKSSKG